jgi:hypothetical protein
MAIAMFSLIIFSLVMMGTITRNFTELLLGDDANAGWDVRADALTTNPIDDFRATLEPLRQRRFHFSERQFHDPVGNGDPGRGADGKRGVADDLNSRA